jgi:hypothetical protein
MACITFSFSLCVNLTFLKIVGIIHRYLDQFKSIINKSFYLYDELNIRIQVQIDSSFEKRNHPFFISIDRIHFKILCIVTNWLHTVGIPFILLLSIKEKQVYLSFIYLFILTTRTSKTWIPFRIIYLININVTRMSTCKII